MHIRGKKKSRKLFEWNQLRSVEGYATRAKLPFDAIRLRSCSIQPETKRRFRLPKVCGVPFDKSILIVGNAPIAGVKDDPRSTAQLSRQRQWREPRREDHRRRIGFEANAFLRNADVGQPLSLIEAQHFEYIDTATPKVGEVEEPAKKQPAAPTLGDEALRMEIHDAIDETFPEHHVEWRYEMQHQRWAAGKQHRIRPPHGSEHRGKQHHVGKNRPRQPRCEFVSLVGAPMDPDHFKCALAHGLT